MLKGLFLSSIVRGYVIVVGLALQFVMAQVMTKDDFGTVNSFISTVLFITFLLSSAPTRQLVRELGTYGLKSKNLMVKSYLNASHLFLALSIALAFISFVIGQTWFAQIFSVTGIVFASSLYSAFFRGLGRYVIGNLEAGVIRMTAFFALIVIWYVIGLEVSSQWVQTLYIMAAALGLLTLIVLRGGIQSWDFKFKALWPYGSLPATMTILAGVDIYTMNYDIIVTNLIYGSEVAAEVRVGQQLRSLTTLPIQIYLMFSLDKLSLALRANKGVKQRQREIQFIRITLGICVALAIMVSDVFTELFFGEPINIAIVIAILGGSLPVVFLGPRPELNIAAANENSLGSSVIMFVIFYTLVVPVFVSIFRLSPEIYFCCQVCLISILYFSLKKLL